MNAHTDVEEKVQHAARPRWILAVAAILALAFLAINLFEAATLPLWYDEGWTFAEITGLLAPDGIQLPVGVVMDSGDVLATYGQPGPFSHVGANLYVHDTHPPLYFQALWLWTSLFGTSALGMRSLSVIATGLAALCVYRFHGDKVGGASLLALAMFLASPSAAYSAVNARGYGLALLLITIGLIAAIRSVQGTKPVRWSLLAGAMAGTAAVTHYFSLLVLLPAMGTASLWLLGQGRWRAVGVGLLGAAPGALWAGLVWLPQQLDARPQQMAGFRDWTSEIIAGSRGFVNQFTVSTFDPPWLGGVILFGAIFLLVFFLRLGWTHRANPAVAIPFMGFFGFFAAMALLFWATDKTMLFFSIPRYSAVTLPAAALLVPYLLPTRLRLHAPSVLLPIAILMGAGMAPRWGMEVFENPWASADSGRFHQETIQGHDGASVVVIATDKIGLLGSLIHQTPPGTPIVYTPGPDAFERWLADVDTAAYDTLYMRPFLWAIDPNTPLFAAPYHDAARAQGFRTEGYTWTKP